MWYVLKCNQMCLFSIQKRNLRKKLNSYSRKVHYSREIHMIFRGYAVEMYMYILYHTCAYFFLVLGCAYFDIFLPNPYVFIFFVLIKKECSILTFWIWELKFYPIHYILWWNYKHFLKRKFISVLKWVSIPSCS